MREIWGGLGRRNADARAPQPRRRVFCFASVTLRHRVTIGLAVRPVDLSVVLDIRPFLFGIAWNGSIADRTPCTESRDGVCPCLSVASECLHTTLGTTSPRTIKRQSDTHGSACYLFRDTFLGTTDLRKGNSQHQVLVSGTWFRSLATSSATVQHLLCGIAIYASPGVSAPSVCSPPKFLSKLHDARRDSAPTANSPVAPADLSARLPRRRRRGPEGRALPVTSFRASRRRTMCCGAEACVPVS